MQGCKKYGIILAFDVPVTREAQELADKEGVRIMRADIIYHLFDQFTAYCKEVGFLCPHGLVKEAADAHSCVPICCVLSPTRCSLVGCCTCELCLAGQGA